jgi:hypothetical protein
MEQYKGIGVRFSVLVGKVENIARKPWITQEMFSKIDERKKWKNVNIEEGRKNYRRLRNELKRAKIIPKRNILGSYVKKLWNLKKTRCYDLMYMKTNELGWKEVQGIKILASKTP